MAETSLYSLIDVEGVIQSAKGQGILSYILPAILKTVAVYLIVETGTDVGETACIFSRYLQPLNGELISIDIIPPKGEWFTNWAIKNITSLTYNSATIPWNRSIDVLFLDSDHHYEHVLAELNHLGPWVRKGGLILLHDTQHPEFGEQIIKAIREWTAQSQLSWTEYPYQFGMATIYVTRQLR